MAGQMVPWLRCWLLFLRTQDSISRIHMAAHNCLELCSQDIWCLLQASTGTANSWCPGKSAGKKIKIKSKKQTSKQKRDRARETAQWEKALANKHNLLSSIPRLMPWKKRTNFFKLSSNMGYAMWLITVREASEREEVILRNMWFGCIEIEEGQCDGSVGKRAFH